MKNFIKKYALVAIICAFFLPAIPSLLFAQDAPTLTNTPSPDQPTYDTNYNVQNLPGDGASQSSNTNTNAPAVTLPGDNSTPAPTTAAPTTVTPTQTTVPTQGTTPSSGNLTLTNPIQYNSIPDLLNAFITILLQIATVVAVIMFIWAGFLYVTAQGDSDKVSRAHQVFKNTVIGTAILLGASAIALVIKGTLNGISGGTSIF